MLLISYYLKRVPILLFFLFVVGFSRGQQQVTVKGKILDTLHNPIINASVSVVDKNNRTVNYNYTDEKGEYSIVFIPYDSLSLYISSIGYTTFHQHLRNLKDTVVTIDVILNEGSIKLSEVVINASKPVTVRKDTITYDAEAYATGNEKVVEDLLKNIPGISIAENGTIKVYGKEVESVMVDGEDLFENGYKILTQNMPSTPVGQIEVLNRFSKNKLLKGIESSDLVALNLKLKEDAKRIWFGNSDLGYSIDKTKRHSLEGNLMNFGFKNKFFALSKFNNIGDLPVEDLGYMIEVDQDIHGTSEIQKSENIISQNGNFLNFREQRYKLNNNKFIAPNAVIRLNEKIKIKSLWAYNVDEVRFFRDINESFNLENENFINSEKFKTNNHSKDHFIQMTIDYDISQRSKLLISNKFINKREKESVDVVFNGIPTNENLQVVNEQLNSEISFTSKINDSKALLIKGVINYDKKDGDYKVNQFFFSEPFDISEDVDNLLQYSVNETLVGTFKGKFFSRTQNDNYWDFQMGNTLINKSLKNNLNAYNEVDSVSLDNSLTTYNANATYINASYKQKFLNFKTWAKVNFQNVYTTLSSEKIDINKNNILFTPFLGVEWQINAVNKIQASYSYNQKIPGILQIQPNLIATGYRTLMRGTSAFSLLSQSNCTLEYENGNFGRDFFFKSMIQFADFDQYFSNSSTILQGYSINEKKIQENGSFISVLALFDQYINFINSSVKLTLQGSRYEYEDVVNDQPRQIKSANYSAALALRSGFKGKLNFNLGSEFKKSKLNTLGSNSTTTFLNFIDVYLNFSSKFSLTLNAEQYILSGISKQQRDFYFVDLTASYKSKDFVTFSFSGVNLFNQNTYVDYRVTEVSLLTAGYELLPRYIMAKVEFRF